MDKEGLKLFKDIVLLEEEEKVYFYIESNKLSMDITLVSLVRVNTYFSMYLLVKLLGTPNLCHRFNWNIEDFNKKQINKYSTVEMFVPIFHQLREIGNMGCFHLNKKSFIVENLSCEEFSLHLDAYISKKRAKKERKINKTKEPLAKLKLDKKGMAFDRFEYGFTDTK